MINVLHLLLAEALLHSIAVWVAIIIAIRLSKETVSKTLAIRLFVVIAVSLTLINLVGSYIEKSAFIDLFIITKSVWIYTIIYLISLNIYRLIKVTKK